MGAYRRPVKFQRRRVPRRHSKYVGIKPNTTVLFIVIFIIACIIGSVMLGNHLKKKAEENKPSILETATQKEEETTKTSSGVSSIAPADGHIRSGCLDISSDTDKDALTKRLRNLFSSGFDSVTLPLSKDGSLLYYSPAAVTLSHMSEDAELPSLTDIVELIKSVGAEYGIAPRVTAYYRLTSPETDDPVLKEAAYLFDTAIISEAYTLGADEVLVSGLGSDLHTDESRDYILLFIEKLKSSSPDIKIGFAFAPEVYCTDEAAATLEKIASGTSFLAVDTSKLDWTYSVTEEPVYTTDENGDTLETTEKVTLSSIYGQIEEITSAAKGSISLYGLRFVLDGTYTYTLTEAIDALYSKGALDYYVISAPESAYSPVEPETTESESETETETETKRPAPQETKPPETTVDTETDAPVDTETDAPVDTETDAPADTETDAPVDTETDAPVDTETDAPVDTETDAPVDTETDAPVDTETDAPIDAETDEASSDTSHTTE